MLRAVLYFSTTLSRIRCMVLNHLMRANPLPSAGSPQPKQTIISSIACHDRRLWPFPSKLGILPKPPPSAFHLWKLDIRPLQPKYSVKIGIVRSTLWRWREMIDESITRQQELRENPPRLFGLGQAMRSHGSTVLVKRREAQESCDSTKLDYCSMREEEKKIQHQKGEEI